MPSVLGILLALGNHLNGGTPKGRADGFALADLGKMTVAKDNANRSSLLEYALAALEGAGEHSRGLRLPDELHLLASAKFKLADVKGALQKLGGEARELEQQARPTAGASAGGAASGGEAALSASEAAADPFTRTMGRFSEQAKAEMHRLTERLNAVDSSYSSLLRYLKIKPTQGGKLVETDELFALFTEFAAAVRTAAPKPKPKPPALRTGKSWKEKSSADGEANATSPSSLASLSSVSSLSSNGRGSTASPAGGAEPASLDPMLSRLRRVSTAVPPKPSAPAAGSPPTVSASSRCSAASVASPSARQSRNRDVDQKLQERLAARFDKAQAKKNGRM